MLALVTELLVAFVTSTCLETEAAVPNITVERIYPIVMKIFLVDCDHVCGTLNIMTSDNAVGIAPTKIHGLAFPNFVYV